MKLSKKTILYISIGAALILVAWYLYRRSKGTATSSTGIGTDDRGSWAAEDDALYQKFRGLFTANELAWMDPFVEQAYNGQPIGGTVPCNDDVKIGGQISKAGSFACLVYGTFPDRKEVIASMYKDLNKLRNKYGAL